MVICMVFRMERKLREIGVSIVITIPRQVCDLYKFNPGEQNKHKLNPCLYTIEGSLHH